MARVPKADNFQVLPGVRQGRAQAVLSQEEATLPGRQMIAQGQQTSQIGGAMAEYAQKQQERVNRVRVQDAYLTAEREALALGQQLQGLKGKDAVGASDAFSNKLQETLGKLEQEISSDAAKMMFRERAGVLQSRFFESTLKYEAEQLDFYETQVLDASVVQAFELISADVANLPSQSATAREALTQKFQNAGLSGEALDQQVRAAMGKSHAVIIDNMLDAGDGAGAKAYFEAVRETDMLETDADALANKVNAGAAVSEAMVSVDALLAEMPMDDFKPAEADKWLRDNISNPEQLKAARAELNYRRGEYQEQEKLQEADNYDTALRIANERGLAAARGSAAWQSLRPAEQNAIRDYFESRAETVRARQAGAETREASATQKKQDAAYYDVIYAEGAAQNLVSLSEGDFRALRSKVGERNFGSLLTMRQELQSNPNKIITVTLDNDKFAEIANRYGYDPLSKDEDDKLELAILRSRIDDEINAAQSAAGRELKREEKDAIISNGFARGALPARVEVRGGWFGGRPVVAADEITAAQISRIRISDIPKEEKRQIIEALGAQYNKTPDARFNPENPDNIIAMYLSLRGVEITE